MVSTAQASNDVLRLIDVADDHPGALPMARISPPIVRALAGGMRRTSRASTEDLDPVGELHELLVRGAGEELGAEVGGDAEREDVDPQVVDHPGQLVYLAGGRATAGPADHVVRPDPPWERWWTRCA